MIGSPARMKTGASEAEKLLREIGGRKGRRGPLPRELRERAKSYVRARAAAGVDAALIAEEIGISARTAERWLEGERKSTSIVPVRMVDVARAATSRTGVVVTTSSGLRIEGLDLDALCTLVARCG